MIRKMLYRTEREGGGYTVSTVRPEKGTRYKIRWRLIADEGRAITDGENVVTVIDLFHRKDCERWTDCKKPEESDPAAIASAAFIPSEPAGLENAESEAEDGEQEISPERDREEGEAYDD